MSKIAIDIDNTICNTSEFFGPMAEDYDRNVLHKNNVINYDKIVPRSDNWTKEELAYFVEKYFNKEPINIPIRKDAVIYINKLKELGYEIIFITNRGIKEDDHTDLIVPEYLDKNNIPYDNIINKSNYKYVYLNDSEYFNDEAISNSEQALEKTTDKVIKIETNKTKDYNSDKIFKTINWKEIYYYIFNDRLNPLLSDKKGS